MIQAATAPATKARLGKKAYNEFLKNLDLHPHGTQIGSGKTKDSVQNRDSGQIEPPSDWADLVHAYSRGTAGKVGS